MRDKRISFSEVGSSERETSRLVIVGFHNNERTFSADVIADVIAHVSIRRDACTGIGRCRQVCHDLYTCCAVVQSVGL